MKTLVVYYSLSGMTRAVAAQLAQELGADIEEMRCTRYRMSSWGFTRAAFDSWADRLPKIDAVKHDASRYDLVAIGGPMWASRAATPVRAYLRQEAGGLPNVALFLTHGGAAPDRAFREMEALAARAPLGTLIVPEKDVKAGQFDTAVRSFAATLRERKAA
jgi:flavodoxin